MRDEPIERLEAVQQGVRERWMSLEDSMEGFGRRALDFWSSVERRPLIMRWSIVFLSVLLATVFGLLFKNYMNLGSQLLLFLPAVLLSALYGGWMSGASASILGLCVSIGFYFQNAETQLEVGQNFIATLLYLLACTIVLALNSAHHYHRRKAMQLAAEMEERVRERTAELEAAHRELSGFCYSISHDLRAPMRNIVSSSRIMVEDAPEELSEESRKRLDSMAASANRLSHLVDDLLGYARLTETELQPDRVDLNKVVDEVCRSLRKQEWPFTTMVCQLEPDLVVGADPVLASLAIRNLLENACKYSKPGQELVIKVGETRLRGKTWFYIRDNGIGFDMQFAGKVFEPFQKLHRDADVAGTGIGLANVKRIVERHGGEIWVESHLGEGTTFYFNFAGVQVPGMVSKGVAQKKVILADEA